MRKICLTILMVLFATNVFALALNDRPVTIEYLDGVDHPHNELGLQQIFDERTVTPDGGSVDAANDQSNVALWNPADDNASTAYLLTMMQTSVSGELGIYNTSGVMVSLGSFDAYSDGGNAGFAFDLEGNLYDLNWNLLASGFGRTFGFYWGSGGNAFFTEDDKNGGQARAVTYQMEVGTEVFYSPKSDGSILAGGTATGDDWLIAFEDGSDSDFQDAVFYVEDIVPTPEPGTLLLLGSGLAGLAAAKRRKKS